MKRTVIKANEKQGELPFLYMQFHQLNDTESFLLNGEQSLAHSLQFCIRRVGIL